MGRALFVVDMQNICVGEEHSKFFRYDRVSLIELVNERIAEFNHDDVFYICKVMRNNFLNKLAPIKVFEGSFEAQIAKAVKVVSKNVIIKYKGDAFSNPELKRILVEKKINEIEFVGIDGGGCVALTALGALENNFKVIINEFAVGTMFVKKAEKYKKILINKGAKFIVSK